MMPSPERDLVIVLRCLNGGFKHPSANARRKTSRPHAEWLHWQRLDGSIVSERR